MLLQVGPGLWTEIDSSPVGVVARMVEDQTIRQTGRGHGDERAASVWFLSFAATLQPLHERFLNVSTTLRLD